MRPGVLKGLIWGTVIAVPLWLVACVTPAVNRGYVICNAFGNDIGCGDPVEINVK